MNDRILFTGFAGSFVENGTMVRTRPTVILVMGILSIIWGSIWVLFVLCSGAQQLVFYYLPLQQAPGAQNSSYRELYDLLQKEVPAYLPIGIAHFAVGLALAVLLIISGVGLLRMRNWARWTAVFYGAATVLTTVAYSIFSWIYILPVTQAWTQKFLSKLPAGAPNLVVSPGFAAVSTIISLIFSLSFPVVLLVFMFLPGVRAAFAGREGTLAKEEGEKY